MWDLIGLKGQSLWIDQIVWERAWLAPEWTRKCASFWRKWGLRWYLLACDRTWYFMLPLMYIAFKTICTYKYIGNDHVRSGGELEGSLICRVLVNTESCHRGTLWKKTPQCNAHRKVGSGAVQIAILLHFHIVWYLYSWYICVCFFVIISQRRIMILQVLILVKIHSYNVAVVVIVTKVYRFPLLKKGGATVHINIPTRICKCFDSFKTVMVKNVMALELWFLQVWGTFHCWTSRNRSVPC